MSMEIGSRCRRIGSVALGAALVAYASACAKGSERSAGSDRPANAPANAGPTGDSAKSTSAAAASPQAGRSASSSERGARLLFVGTSLTAGLGLEPDSAYPMRIQRKIDSLGLKIEVTNAGVSGETSAGLLDRLDWLLRGDFDYVVIETGANDGLRGVPVVALRKNLETALDRIKTAKPAAKIFLVRMEALPNLGPRYAADFHAVYPAVAKEKGVALLPFLLDGVAGRRELNQADGIHPNNAGERIVADGVWRALEPALLAARRP